MSVPAIRENLQNIRAAGIGDNLALSFAKLNRTLDAGSEHETKDRIIDDLADYSISDKLQKSYGYAFRNWLKAQSQRPDTLCFYIEATTKLLFGTGNDSGLEFGLNLNRPWGVPFIHGSSLKGLASSYLYRKGGEDWWRSSSNTDKSDYQVELFGGTRKEDKQAYIGSVHFYDAWLSPKETKWFQKDILTPHHQNYYQQGDWPSGTKNPVPVKMLALQPGLRFLVCLSGPENALKFIKKVLLQALEEEGLGGKTAVGYGRFRYLPDPVDRFARQETAKEIQNEKDPQKLRELFRKYNGISQMRPLFEKKAEEINEYSENLEGLLSDLSPLKLIELKIKAGKIDGMKNLSRTQLGRNICKAIDELAQSRPLKESPAGQSLFNTILEQWKPDDKAIQENWLTKQIAYTWEDLSPDSDRIYKIIEDIEQKKHTWPPASELEGYVKATNRISETEKAEILEFLAVTLES